MLTRLVKIIIPRDGYSIRSTKGVPKVTFSDLVTYRSAEIPRYGSIFFEDTDIPGRTVFQDMRRT